MMPSPPVQRPYGQACTACRQRKRKCRPSEHRSGVCVSCEKTGEVCESFSKRRSTRHDRTPTESSVTGHLGDTSARLGSDDNDYIDNTRDLPGPLIPAFTLDAPGCSIQGASAMFSFRTTISPAVSVDPDHSTDSWSLPRPGGSFAAMPTENETTPRSMAHSPGMQGSTYQSAMSNLVKQVCGESSDLRNDEILLGIYFAWQAPQHMPVDEELFRRDMATRPYGPYFSPLLLYTIQAQASRHLMNGDDGRIYADRANALLVSSLNDLPTIPTIQALLILSGRDLALGFTSAGWLKSGMAFRMISEMRLGSDLPDETVESTVHSNRDVAIRERVFWSAYSWDKFFALALGRQPAVTLPEPIPQIPLILDETLWRPFGCEDVAPEYPARPSLMGQTFKALSQLNIELDSIIRRLYNGRKDVYREAPFVDDLSTRLLDWRSKVSSQVLMDTSYLPALCPPPHILTLNILYRTTWILLQRPLIRHDVFNVQARQACVAKSAEINLLFRLHDKTFALRNITYIMAYMAYVTATVDVAEIMSGDPTRSASAADRLELTLRVLTQAAHHTPGIQRSIHHLRNKLKQPSGQPSSLQSGATTPTTAHPSGQAANPDQITRAMESGIQSSGPGDAQNLGQNYSVFGDLSLGAGFEELFATLLPEYSSDSTLPWLHEDSTANLFAIEQEWDNV